MHGLSIVTYLIALVYIANFFMLSAVARRAAGRPVWLFAGATGRQRLTASAFRVSFAVAFLWPGVLLIWHGGWRSDDPLAQVLHGMPAALTGHVLVAVGTIIALLSQHHMGASWRVGTAAGELGPLVDTGPFAVSRNPVFLGQGVLLIGLVLAFPDLVQLAAALLGFTAIVAQALIEERALRETYGADYDSYAARVPRWLGRVGTGAADANVRTNR